MLDDVKKRFRSTVTRPLGPRASIATIVLTEAKWPPKRVPVAQTLRAARNRERGELRALIAQRRKSSNAAVDAGESPEGSPDGDGSDPVREWSTPSGWAAGSPVPRPRQPDARIAASEPPPRRRFRSPNGVVPSKGALAAGDKVRSPGGGSVDAPHRPRGSRNKDGEENHKAAAKGKAASSSSKVARFVMSVFCLALQLLAVSALLLLTRHILPGWHMMHANDLYTWRCGRCYRLGGGRLPPPSRRNRGFNWSQ